MVWLVYSQNLLTMSFKQLYYSIYCLIVNNNVVSKNLTRS